MMPDDFECVLTYCTNATNEVMESGIDYEVALRRNSTPYKFEVYGVLVVYMVWLCKSGSRGERNSR